MRGLRIGHSHLVWQNLDTVPAVRKGVIQARFLTGVYLLQSNRHMFSNKTVDPNCRRLCQLGVENIHHVVTWCPAYHNIQTLTTSQLKNFIIDNSDFCVWKTHFSNWDNLLRIIIICPDIIRVMVPELSSVTVSVTSSTVYKFIVCINDHIVRMSHFRR